MKRLSGSGTEVWLFSAPPLGCYNCSQDEYFDQDKRTCMPCSKLSPEAPQCSPQPLHKPLASSAPYSPGCAPGAPISPCPQTADTQGEWLCLPSPTLTYPLPAPRGRADPDPGSARLLGVWVTARLESCLTGALDSVPAARPSPLLGSGTGREKMGVGGWRSRVPSLSLGSTCLRRWGHPGGWG